MLIFTSSSCNTPILPVHKEGKFDADGNQICQSVQDLRALSHSSPLNLPYSFLNSGWCSLVSSSWPLLSILFCPCLFWNHSVPVSFCIYIEREKLDTDSSTSEILWFPSIFSQVLKADLDSVAFTQVSMLVGYVIDDLLLCNQTKQGALNRLTHS